MGHLFSRLRDSIDILFPPKTDRTRSEHLHSPHLYQASTFSVRVVECGTCSSSLSSDEEYELLYKLPLANSGSNWKPCTSILITRCYKINIRFGHFYVYKMCMFVLFCIEFFVKKKNTRKNAETF